MISGEHEGPVVPAPGWRRLSGDALIYLASAALSALIPFALLPLMTRWLGPADFGVTAGYLALVNLVVLLAGLSTHGLISVVYYRDGPEALPRQVGASFGILALTGLPLLLIAQLAAQPIALYTGVTAQWIWTVWLAAYGQCVITIALAVWQTWRRPWRFGATQVGFGLVSAAFSIALVGYVAMGWPGRALGQALAAGLIAGAAIIWLTLTGGVSWSVRRWPLRDALVFGLPLVPHALAWVAMSTVDRFALGSAVGPSAVGPYFVAVQMSSVVMVLGAALSQAWLPWLYQRLATGGVGSHRQVVRVTAAILIVLFACGAGLSLLAPLIVPIVAGPGFEPAVGLLRVLGPAFAFIGMYYFVSAFLFFERRTGLLSTITVCVAIVQAATSFVLAQQAGAAGVAYATLGSFFLYLVLTGIAAHRVHPLPWRYLWLPDTQHGAAPRSAVTANDKGGQDEPKS
jgi:O-antigen/teichoic acid export membrane protein